MRRLTCVLTIILFSLLVVVANHVSLLFGLDSVAALGRG